MASNSLSKWRFIQHAGDGCAIYQCLGCRQMWESRTEPGWTDVMGGYHHEWRFCPYCGIEWTGGADQRSRELAIGSHGR